MSSTLDNNITFIYFRKYSTLSVKNHIKTLYKPSKYLDIVNYIVITISCRNGHLQAEFLPRAYGKLCGHLEFKIINA